MNPNRGKPPWLASILILWIARYENETSLLGDFDEEYWEIRRQRGAIIAGFWYWRHLLISLPPILGDLFYFGGNMLINFFKTAYRHLKNGKEYTFINLLGLAAGLTAVLLIVLWVASEMSFDRFHENGDRIYRLWISIKGGVTLESSAVMAPAAPAFKNEFPEVLAATRLAGPHTRAVRHQNLKFHERGVGYADNDFFDIFTFPLLAGDPHNALVRPYTVVVNESVAQKYFGEENPLGQTLKIDGDREFTVTGVMEDFPQNSHIQCRILCSFSTHEAEGRPGLDNWMDIEYRTYVLLDEKNSAADLESKIPDLLKKHLGPQLSAQNVKVGLHLMPLHDIHLRSHLKRDNTWQRGSQENVLLFSSIALFILLIAAINFVNLTTARSAHRAREVGLRKTLGASRRGLILQFLSESSLITLIALGVALICGFFILPWFNALLGRDLFLTFKTNLWMLPAALGLACMTGIVAGSFPAFFLSSFQPSQTIKGRLATGAAHSRMRNGLVIVQFTISITLMIATFTVYRQIHFLKNKRLGFNREAVMVIPDMGDAIRESWPQVRSDILSLPGVAGCGASSLVPGRGNLIGSFLPEGFDPQDRQRMDYVSIDANYLPVMEMGIAAGRNFSDQRGTDADQAVMINETAAARFGWTEPLGKKFFFGPPDRQTAYSVIGVVRDFHRASLHHAIEPLILFLDTEAINHISIRVQTGQLEKSVKNVKALLARRFPDRPFRYFFLDDTLDRLYLAETQIGNISLVFSLLAILIGCLGLFGLAAFIAEKRTKEMGIRKVLGATTAKLTMMLNREFVWMVGISNLLAWPLAFWGLKKWLEGYAYRISPHVLTFLATAAGAFLIALGTVSWHAIKTARSDPAQALKYE